ncbi:MAG TPA: DUF4114 domain-containing protein [Flavisolibacter sp.]|jgi:hypothetical protein|nr:DUF4114 domain-containing protein [Flavisolibacter sp.]
MKTLNLNQFVVFLLLLIGCQKEPVTKPVYFTETEYEPLASYDDKGRPSNLEKETVSAELMNFAKTSLPERQDLRNTNPALLETPTVDMRITKKSEVYLTFISQGTVFGNTIGFYTYPTTNPPASPKDIKKIYYVFPSAGNLTALTAGHKVKIGTFEPGVSIGLVLLKGAWKPESREIDNKAVHFCYSDVLNPEVDPKLKKHVVLAEFAPENKILIGFEDFDRTDSNCDHDFNDVVMYATITEL